MAPSESVVEWQTYEIIRCLLEDEDDVKNRLMVDGDLEIDSPEDDFDPVLIAGKLRSIADNLVDDPAFSAVLKDMKKAVTKEVTEAAFSQGVEALCQTHFPQTPDAAPEIQLIRASVSFGLYIKKFSPDLRSTVPGAMRAFLNRRVRTWVTQQGGWDKVNI